MPRFLVHFTKSKQKAMASRDSQVSVEVSHKMTGRSKTSSCIQKRQLLHMIGVTVVPIFTLIALNIVFVHDATRSSQTMKVVQDQIEHSILDFGPIIHCLQIERGQTALYISSNSPEVFHNLQHHYNSTNLAVYNASRWISLFDHTDHYFKYPRYFASKETFLRHIQDFRDQVSPDSCSLYNELKFYTDIIAYLNKWTVCNFRVEADANIWGRLVSFEQLNLAKDHAGIERALGSTFFALGGFHNYSLYRWFLKESSYEDALLYVSTLYSSDEASHLNHLLELYHSDSIEKMKYDIIINDIENQQPSLEMGNDWFQKMTDYIDELFTIQAHFADNVRINLTNVIDDLETEMITSISIMSVCVLISPLIVQLIVLQTRKIQQMSRKLECKMVELDQERERSEHLLHQMLPPSVARELKMGKDVHAEYFDQVTIFFSDLVNFTNVCSQSTPLQVVEMLNTLYLLLDGTIEQFDAYKVETIGDAYMVASGVPIRNQDHAAVIARMSIAIRYALRHLTIPHMEGHRYVIRIGIHTGPCAAGVVGRKMPRYCLFGDSVNTASRMESIGKADKIHLSEATYRALQTYKHFEQFFRVIPRGCIVVKGKGLMSTFWLECTRSYYNSKRQELEYLRDHKKTLSRKRSSSYSGMMMPVHNELSFAQYSRRFTMSLAGNEIQDIVIDVEQAQSVRQNEAESNAKVKNTSSDAVVLSDSDGQPDSSYSSGQGSVLVSEKDEWQVISRRGSDEISRRGSDERSEGSSEGAANHGQYLDVNKSSRHLSDLQLYFRGGRQDSSTRDSVMKESNGTDNDIDNNDNSNDIDNSYSNNDENVDTLRKLKLGRVANSSVQLPDIEVRKLSPNIVLHWSSVKKERQDDDERMVPKDLDEDERCCAVTVEEYEEDEKYKPGIRNDQIDNHVQNHALRSNPDCKGDEESTGYEKNVEKNPEGQDKRLHHDYVNVCFQHDFHSSRKH